MTTFFNSQRIPKKYQLIPLVSDYATKKLFKIVHQKNYAPLCFWGFCCLVIFSVWFKKSGYLSYNIVVLSLFILICESTSFNQPIMWNSNLKFIDGTSKWWQQSEKFSLIFLVNLVPVNFSLSQKLKKFYNKFKDFSHQFNYEYLNGIMWCQIIYCIIPFPSCVFSSQILNSIWWFL